MVHLQRGDLAPEGFAPDQAGEPVGLSDLLGSLDRQARDSRAGRVLGRAVERAVTWDAADRRDERWWPQGVTTSADAAGSGRVSGRELVVTSWYSKAGDGVRLSFLDLDALRYRHVRLVRPVREPDGTLRLEPLGVHAGGIVWAGGHLHVAATGRGFFSAGLDDLVHRDGDLVLPVRAHFRAGVTGTGPGLRFSFLSLDRSTDPPSLLAGEYGRGTRTTRLATFALDPDTFLPAADDGGTSRPTSIVDAGLRQMQGAALVGGRLHVVTSRGPHLPGTVHVGGPGRWRRFRCATPMGPEDLAYWPQTGRLWCQSEHPGRRWVFSMRADRFG